MAENNATPNNNNQVFSENDPLDINELASLNKEISNDLIEQLQNKISEQSNVPIKNDGDLFEETSSKEQKGTLGFNSDIDDNFIKKYKAKLKKQQTSENDDDYNLKSRTVPEVASATETDTQSATETEPVNETTNAPVQNSEEPISSAKTAMPASSVTPDNSNIEAITGGNIIEKPIKKEDIEYNDSLDLIDNNVKYSKYVIYIDPENKDFIDSLTVKERKNLINRIIREQDSITVTKRRFCNMQAIFAHTFIAILTIAIAVPCIYWIINASLEATINSYRASQVVFGQLYKDNGKIKATKSIR